MRLDPDLAACDRSGLPAGNAMIEIDGFALGPRRRRDQPVGGAGIEPKTAFEQAMKLALFQVGRLAVERNDVNQKRRRRQAIAGIVKGLILMRGGGNNVGDELAESVQHYF